MTYRFLFGFAACAIAFAICSHAANYYVATDGLDSNGGTNLAAPFGSLAKATAVMVAGDTCWIRGGTYRETLTLARSGTAALPVTFAAYGNEVVTLNGADAVTGWSPYTNSIYQAPLGWDLGEGFNQVFVDGQMMVQARYPNLGSADLLHPPLADMTATNALSINCSALTQTNDFWKGGIVVGGFYERWAFQCAKITSSVPGTVFISQASSPWFTKGVYTNGGQGYVTGVLGALDTTNEWHYAAGTLYLWAPGSASPAGHLVEVKRRPWCIDFNGQSNAVVRGLKCFAGAIRMNSNYDRLEDCDVQYLSHFTYFSWSGHAAGGGANGGFNGIYVPGSFNQIRNCRIAWSAGSGIVLNGTSNLVTRTAVHDVDYSGTYACPVYVYGVGHEVSFNTLYNTGRDVMNGNPRGAMIRFNDCYNSGLLCRDLGVLYFGFSDGQGTRIAYNWVHDNQEGGPYGPGIYLDNYNRNFTVDHNVIWNCAGDAGIRVNAPACSNLVCHNTLFLCQDVGTHTYDQWPDNNPEPAFWTTNLYRYVCTNNLFLGANAASQLQDYAGRDFRLKAGAASIDSGVVVSGFTDGYQGSAPDKGAYESGSFRWTAGTNGAVSDVPGMFNTAVTGLTFSAAWLNGMLVATDEVPAEVLVFWGGRDGGAVSQAWQHRVSLGSNAVPIIKTFSLGVSNLIADATYFYRYCRLDASGELWATSSVSFSVPNTTNVLLNPVTDVQVDPVEWVSTGGPSGDSQNTNPSNDVTSAGAILGAARSGNSGGDLRSFLKFDLSGLLVGMVVTSATLRLYLEGTGQYGGTSLSRVTSRDWTSNTVVYGLGSASSTVSIASFASSTTNYVPPAVGWYDLNVTPTVAGWFGGSLSNCGFVIRGVEGWGDTSRRFTSSRGTATQRPQLVVGVRACLPDGDGDGLPDVWEAWAFGGTNEPNGGPLDDPDQDGACNRDEYLAGTDPADAASVFAVTEFDGRPGGGVTISWRSTTGKTYSVCRGTNLIEDWGSGTLLTNGMPGESGGVSQFTDPTPPPDHVFYQVRAAGL